MRNVLQCTIDLILRQRGKDSLHVVDLGNAMADHRQVVSCRDGQANCVLEPIPSEDRAHIEIVCHDEAIETEFVAQQIGDDPTR